MEEEEKRRELQRQMDLISQDGRRQIQEVVKKYEKMRKLDELKQRKLQRLTEVVRQEWAKTVASQTWRLTEEEVKELKRLRKQEAALHLKIQRLREKEAMSETGTCTESEDMSGDERGQQQKQREKDRWPHLEQQQLDMRSSETLSKPHQYGSTGSPVNWLWREEIEQFRRLRKQLDSILLKIKKLEDKETKPRNEADKLRLEGNGRQDTSVTCKLKQGQAETEQKHEELGDDWLGGVDLMKSEDKWSEIRRKHQQSREDSRQERDKQGLQGQQTETNTCAVVRRRGRPVARTMDATEQTLTELTELNKQGRKEVKKCGNEGMDCLGGTQQRVVKGRRGSVSDDEVEELSGSVLLTSAEDDRTPGATDFSSAANADSGTRQDKSVPRRVFGWVNKRVKNYYQKKIERTHVREEEEGDQDYHPWYFDCPISRAERELQKRQELLKKEATRQRIEASWRNWEAKIAKKKEKARAKKQENQQKLKDIEEHLRYLANY
ncbi:hypothetical protein AALO_G00181650 [Alosa alosa]|uniref:Uncharacterized protein n=1 Tax=Alosa alosa TaxID=278164 RepID=A0AAV6GDJ7_9TELE|nr:hypothetical protein AALO_G00181650 [Alosa alosa]